ncbi:hypothetical protein J0383_17795 [Flavobacterium endoglycinae]|uniref:Lipoprotein n=1 Tax=Flavobacterium endoglycinae TaxID=2816357 RepID=A0ABX7QBQ6_9FLAO|nr:hypothetical protein [Flavobacterium endoglycinae]QSW88109.1 hypothetical protein J0383_17795 [Flavobacterium endoglycinae]
MKNRIFALLVFALIFEVSCQKKDVVKIPELKSKKEVKKQVTQPAVIKEIKKSKTCLDVVFDILTTSPTFVNKTKGLNEAIRKNGGTSYGIVVEGSPNPKEDDADAFSKTYDFNLHESYPDRIATIARYTFDPSKKELYEYNVAEDTLKPIKFNKELLLEFDKTCK